MENNNIIKALDDNKNVQKIIANAMQANANLIDAVQNLTELPKVTDYTRNEIRNDLHTLSWLINAAVSEAFGYGEM